MGNYNFEKDLQRSEQTERDVAKLIKRYFGNDLKPKFCNDNSYDVSVDIEGKTYTFEVKEDFMCMLTKNVCVEFECRGKPSGIAVSKANFFIYKIHESPVQRGYYICSTKTLRKMIEEQAYFRIFESGGDPGSNTKGYLFKLDKYKSFTDKM